MLVTGMLVSWSKCETKDRWEV